MTRHFCIQLISLALNLCIIFFTEAVLPLASSYSPPKEAFKYKTK